MGHCRSDIEQAVDQDSGKMQARLKYIAIEQLVHYAGKKVKPAAVLMHRHTFSNPGAATSQAEACLLTLAGLAELFVKRDKDELGRW